MEYQYKKHYTLEEARTLLPKVREWFERLNTLRNRLLQTDERLTQLLTAGNDLGGELVNTWVKLLAEIKAVLVEFQTRDIQVKDLERGLIDFPAIMGGKEVFLCWELDEEDIEFWHELDTGYSGRERL